MKIYLYEQEKITWAHADYPCSTPEINRLVASYFLYGRGYLVFISFSFEVSYSISGIFSPSLLPAALTVVHTACESKDERHSLRRRLGGVAFAVLSQQEWNSHDPGLLRTCRSELSRE